MKFQAILGLLRWKNLLIVGLTLACIYFKLGLSEANSPVFRAVNYSLLSLVFLLVTAAGNIINDIYDQERDLINRPDKTIIGKKVSRSSSYTWYFGIILIGILCISYLGYTLKSPEWIAFYLLFNGILWLYAYKLKCSVILGNLTISALCALVIISPLVLDYQLISGIEVGELKAITLLIFYSIMAFGLTLCRELIKDIEDIEGDQATNCSSTAVVLGSHNTLNIVRFLCGIILAISMIIIGYCLIDSKINLAIILAVLLLAPLVYLFFLLMQKTNINYFRIDTWFKVCMIFGLLILILV